MIRHITSFSFLMKKMLLIACLSLALSACGNTAPNTNEADTPSVAPAPAGEEAAPANTPEAGYTDGTVMETDYSITLSNFTFSEDVIEVKAGETIKVYLETTQGTHDFVIDELNVQSTTLNTGASEVIEITAPADAAGKEFAFYCSIGKHRENGMEGILRITE